MKNKIVRKVLIYGISVVLVAGVVGALMAVREAKMQAELEASFVDPIPVMTQEEMEALYDQNKKDNTEETENLETEEVVEEDVEAIEEETTTSSAYEGCPVDFDGMWKVNPDVYAWITIPGTVIDYPILQHATDNSYYLNYNIDGSYGRPGCIYTENTNSKEFTDNNTIIYGHNMRNGSMFADLHKFEDATFFEEHRDIIIYTPEKELKYTVFAAYVYDDRHLMYSFNFADEQVFANYLNNIQNMRSMNAFIREDVTVTADDNIITLSTCMAKQPSNRYLVQAVLQQDEVTQ